MRYTRQLLATLTVALPLAAWALMPNQTAYAAQNDHTAVAAMQDPTAGMPDGPGKDITIKTCTKCHSITNVTAQHKSQDAWTETITKMVGYGATGSDDDFAAILAYVTKYYGDQPAPPADGAAPPPAAK